MAVTISPLRADDLTAVTGHRALYLDGLMSTADALEGLTAFIERRPATWRDA